MMLKVKEILENVKVILASSSPQRKKLLEQIGIAFQIIPSQFDEEKISKESFKNPEDYVKLVAHEKALSVAETLTGDGATFLVIGADTVIVHNKCIIGKPHTADKAIATLQELSGKSHSVCTGVSLIQIVDGKQRNKVFTEITKVQFGSLSYKEILGYVNTGEPLNKAGAYGIQGFGATLVESIDGDYSNVVGFPLYKFCQEVDNFFSKEL